MGPKVKFTKEQIIDATFEIAKTEGIDSIKELDLFLWLVYS